MSESHNPQMQSIFRESLHVNEDIATEALAGNVCQTHKDRLTVTYKVQAEMEMGWLVSACFTQSANQ